MGKIQRKRKTERTHIEIKKSTRSKEKSAFVANWFHWHWIEKISSLGVVKCLQNHLVCLDVFKSVRPRTWKFIITSFSSIFWFASLSFCYCRMVTINWRWFRRNMYLYVELMVALNSMVWYILLVSETPNDDDDNDNAHFSDCQLLKTVNIEQVDYINRPNDQPFCYHLKKLPIG